MKSMKEMLLMAPTSQFDGEGRAIVARWSEPALSIEILEALDYCIAFGAASTFVVTLLQGEYQKACWAEGVEHIENVRLAHWRKLLDA